MLLECLLQWMEVLFLGQPLYRHQVRTVRLDGKHQAGTHRSAVEEKGARSTDAVLAPEMRACEAKLVTKEVCEGRPDFD